MWKFFLPDTLRDRAEEARQAHNLKVGGSIPSPATNIYRYGDKFSMNVKMEIILYYYYDSNGNAIYTSSRTLAYVRAWMYGTDNVYKLKRVYYWEEEL